MDGCIFCQIGSGEVSSNKILETEHFLAFDDSHPKAPVHVLIIPKKHLERPEDLEAKELKEMFDLSKDVAVKKDVFKDGYRLVFNVGKKAGQEINHVHLHLLGGTQAKALY